MHVLLVSLLALAIPVASQPQISDISPFLGTWTLNAPGTQRSLFFGSALVVRYDHHKSPCRRASRIRTGNRDRVSAPGAVAIALSPK